MPDGYRPSLLANLTDERPRSAIDDQPTAISRARLLKELADDVERLLNSRMRGDGVHDPRSAQSLDYGLPDFGVSLASQMLHHRGGRRHADRIAHQVAEALRLFEPRLRRVRVVPAEESEDTRRLRLVITAELAEPPYDPIVWSTETNTGTGQLRVTSGA